MEFAAGGTGFDAGPEAGADEVTGMCPAITDRLTGEFPTLLAREHLTHRLRSAALTRRDPV